MTSRQNQCHQQLARIGPKRKRQPPTRPKREPHTRPKREPPTRPTWGHWDKLLRGPRGLVAPDDFVEEGDDDSFSRIEVTGGAGVTIGDIVHVKYPLSDGEEEHSYRAGPCGNTHEVRFGTDTYWQFTPTGFVFVVNKDKAAEAKWLLELPLATKPVPYGSSLGYKLVFTLKPKPKQ